MGADYMGNHTSMPDIMEEEPRFIMSGKVILSYIVGVFLIAILFVFPLYYKNYYFDILNAKYQFYYISVLSMMGCVVITLIVMLIMDLVKCNGRYTVRFFKCFAPDNIWNTITIPDIALFFSY